MSEMSINQVLAQMRAVKADIEVDAATTKVGETKPGGVEFSQILSDSINKVAETQNHAAAMSKAFQAGDNTVELPEVMIALQKSSISFEAMTQVRNKLLSAYQEIMRMPV